jgi:hypothetical protein
VEDGVDMDRVFRNQLDIALEGGVRLSPHLALGLYADIGVGEPAREIENGCNDFGFDCNASRTRVGLLLRHTFQPYARTTPWLALGTGIEHGSIEADDGVEQFSYSGWEMLRLTGGIDVRSSPVFGVGFYGGVAFGRYSDLDDPTGRLLGDERTHTTVMAGVRFTLFP